MTRPMPPSQIAIGRRQLMLVFAGLMLGMFLSSLDQTIIATALPTIVGDLGGLDHLSWVVTSYLLATTVSTPLYGKLGDLYGRKKLFQAAIVIFLVGSVLSGLAQDMNQLIAFRALQGIGAGGLMVGAQAIIGDIVPPAERGRYMGVMGSVFAVSSVLGPLLGGFFTDNLTWRWVFYINLPVGAIALFVVGLALPSVKQKIEHRIDYLGAALLSIASTALILILTWGGTQYSWTSRPILLLVVVTIAVTGGFIYVESRASEPVLPLRLFGNRVFRVSSVAGAVLGFSMFGAITFVPVFLQTVHLVSPTLSGLQMLPIMAFILMASIFSGRRISATGRYRRFPILGSILLTIGIAVLAYFGTGLTTPYWQSALGMAIIGLGLGLTMQVFVLAVQNAVDQRDLGVATSSATFLRSIGGSVGVAVFGDIYASRLAAALKAGHVQVSKLGGDVSHLTPAQLTALKHHSPVVFGQFLHAFNHALHIVFVAGIPVAALGIVASLLLPEVPLRRTAGRGAGLDAADAQAMPEAPETAAVMTEAAPAGVH